MQEQIARTRGGERFSVLNNAYLPRTPESPNRPRLLLMALALGFAFGGASVNVHPGSGASVMIRLRRISTVDESR